MVSRGDIAPKEIFKLFKHLQRNHTNMKDKVIVITGASSGIGRALAREYARHGSKLVLAARRLERMKALEQEFPEVEILSVQTDVAIEEDCKAMVQAAVDRFGRIDVLINNAGISMRAMFEDCDLQVLHRLMDVNFWGTVYCTKYAIPHIKKTKGSILGMISIAAYVGLPARIGYASSKCAVRGFMNTLRIELLKTGVHTMLVAPAFTASEVRESALVADGSEQGKTPLNESKLMSAEACAAKVYKAQKRRKRRLVLTFKEGKLAVFLHKWVPDVVDYFNYRMMSKEIGSPIK